MKVFFERDTEISDDVQWKRLFIAPLNLDLAFHVENHFSRRIVLCCSTHWKTFGDGNLYIYIFNVLLPNEKNETLHSF